MPEPTNIASNVFGREREFKVGNEVWKVRFHTLADEAKLQNWIASTQKSPIQKLIAVAREAAANDQGLYADLIKFGFKEAKAQSENWPPAYNSAEFRSIMIAEQNRLTILGFALGWEKPRTDEAFVEIWSNPLSAEAIGDVIMFWLWGMTSEDIKEEEAKKS